ncbi:amidohydrolase family protein [Bartonella tamiae]|uniref:amidohydrolase family protein n=1 Tax=Bartonella tamiae TaxID=373638 RepID=UPI000310993A|nr:amidohydrolase family protein [Bartonella tamiae]
MPFIKSQNYVYEVFIHQKDLSACIEFCKRYDKAHIVIDHLAKPIFEDECAFDQWCTLINELKSLQHVFLKVSGLITEVKGNFHANTFQRHIDILYETVGVKRLLWGSDWPVVTSKASYEKVLSLWNYWIKNWTIDERYMVEEINPQRIYHL